MTTPDGARPAGSVGTRAPYALLVAAAIAAALVCLTRVASWQECWRWTITEGREGQTIYAIWRFIQGAPLYTPPNEEPYALTYLNFGFYWAYGTIVRALNAGGEPLLWVGRLVTTLGSVVGTLLFVSTAKLLAVPRSRLEWLALWSLAFVVWFGTQFIAWWILSIRPDVWAAVFALGGLRLALPALATPGVGRLVVASLVFALAWSFKQSCILSLLGCCLAALLVARSWRALAALTAPFGLFVVLCLGLGGDVYRTNIIAVPGASTFHLSLLTENLSRALPQNPWVFGFFPLVFSFEWARRRKVPWDALPVMVRVLAVVVVVTVALGSVALGREGSNKNHLFEGYIASALASYWALGQTGRSQNATRSLLALAVVSLLPLVAFPVAQLAMPNRLGRTVLCSKEDVAELRTYASEMERLPKPLFTEDEIFSLPWHSTDGRYPAIVIDGTLYGIAKREGLLAEDFPAKLFVQPRFRSVVLIEGHPELTALKARAVPCRNLSSRPFGLQFVACSLPMAPN